jgi:NSS family neurotransmitter:Na+ symporter
MITYGSYLDRKTNIFSSTATIAGLDAGIALLAGVAIFPAVFAMGIEPGSGPGLTFQALPLVFNQLPAGSLLATIFFLLLTIAAITSAISLLEVMVSFATVELGWVRRRSTLIMAATATVLGIPVAMSFGSWSDITIFGKTFFGIYDYATANVMLPLGGIMIALFAGWFWGKLVREEMLAGSGQETLYKIWLWSVRIIAPIAVALVLFNSLFGS